jgi:hypothetical protein
MKKGDKVYCVVSVFGNDDFALQERTLIVVTDKQLRLDSYFCGGLNIKFPPNALGRDFFASPREAIDVFEERQIRNAATAKASAVSAEERARTATAWAEQWRTQHLVFPCTKEIFYVPSLRKK